MRLRALAASLSAVAEDARGLLERMERVLATRNYQGTFVHEHDGQTETMKIVHRAENGDFAERVVSLDGSRREVVQRDGELRAYFPDQRVVLVEGGPKGGLLLSGLAGLDSASAQLYRMSEEIADPHQRPRNPRDRRRTAGRPALRLPGVDR